MDLELRFTGLVNSWTMPIKNRTDMLSTGIRTTLGVKVFGPDLVTIQAVGAEIEALLAPVDGTASIFAERSFGGRYLDTLGVRPDRWALARHREHLRRAVFWRPLPRYHGRTGGRWHATASAWGMSRTWSRRLWEAAT